MNFRRVCWPELQLKTEDRYLSGPFVKFLDSPYYSKSELCGGVVTVSFLKYLLWQVMHFLQCSTHFSKHAADCSALKNFLPWSSLFLVGKAQKSHEASSGLYGGCSDEVPLIHFFHAEHRIQFISHPM
jgi:hypothetical protein